LPQKNAQRVLQRCAPKKGVVPVIASRINPASRNRPIAGGKANFTPDPEWIDLLQAIRNRAAALRGRPVELSLKLLRIGRRSHRRRCFRRR